MPKIDALLHGIEILGVAALALIFLPDAPAAPGPPGDLVKRVEALEATVDALSQLAGDRIRTGDVIVTGLEPPPRPIVSTEELADELGINADTVRRRAAAGTLVGFTKTGRDQWQRE